MASKHTNVKTRSEHKRAAGNSERKTDHLLPTQLQLLKKLFSPTLKGREITFKKVTLLKRVTMLPFLRKNQ